jgi:hypothetical protein
MGDIRFAGIMSVLNPFMILLADRARKRVSDRNWLTGTINRQIIIKTTARNLPYVPPASNITTGLVNKSRYYPGIR